jgi:hypothetical protein
LLHDRTLVQGGDQTENGGDVNHRNDDEAAGAAGSGFLFDFQMIWTFHALSLKTGIKTRHTRVRVRQTFFEIRSLNPKQTQPDAYDWRLAGRF